MRGSERIIIFLGALGEGPEGDEGFSARPSARPSECIFSPESMTFWQDLNKNTFFEMLVSVFHLFQIIYL